MGIRKFVHSIITVAFVFPGLSCAKNIREYNESEIFQNFAYSICVGSAFESEEVKSDANRSANAYIQFSNISLESYEEVRKKADSWLARDCKSKSDKSLQLMKCIDFINSGDVQEIFVKYDPCKNKENWLDTSEYEKFCK